MKVKTEGKPTARDYAEVSEEAIEQLRVADDRRVPGVPQSVENIALQCTLLRIFGNTSNTALLVRYHIENNVAIVVTRESHESSYRPSAFLLWEKEGEVALTDSIVKFLE